MGGQIAAQMQQTMKKNMEENAQNMQNFQKEIMMKQRQLQLAVEISKARYRFKYYSYFIATAAPLMIIGAIKRKDPKIAGPLLPLSFAWAFQYDLCYGDMLIKVRDEAEQLIAEQNEKFFLPKGNQIMSQEEYERVLNIKKTNKGQKQI